MTVKSGQVISGIVITTDGTGALVAATGIPEGTLYVDGVANGAEVAIIGLNPYSWTVTLPALTVGQTVQLYVTATVAGITVGGVVWEDVSDTALLSDLSAEVWAHSPRTLTQTAAEVAAVLEGSSLTIQRGDTLTIALTGLGNIAARTRLWFTVKRSTIEADTLAQIQITEDGGLLYIAGGAATTPTNGSISVTDPVTGAITITLAAAETAKLTPTNQLAWDVQMLSPAGVETLTEGRAVVVADVTRETQGPTA